MKKELHRKLFIGPMTKNVVDAVIFHDSNRKQFGLLPSRRQIETVGLGSGYVNNWSTEDFKKYSSDVLVLRDHGGPGQGKSEDDGMQSFKADIASGITFLHVDPWKKASSIEEASLKTVEIIRECNQMGDVFYEIGTESAIYEYTPKDLAKFLALTKKSLGSEFENIVYCVVQSGTKVRETKNVGIFQDSSAREMCSIVHDYGLLAKEHNSDYLSESEFKERKECGVNSFNIAPEFGVLETKTLMNILLDADIKLYKEFVQICYESNKWKKWVDSNPSLEKAALICGHYNFANQRVTEIKALASNILSLDIDNHLKSVAIEKLASIEEMVK